LVGLLATSTIAPAQDQTVTVGPWTIATSFKADKFDSCTMNRSVSDLDITFLRTHDGLLLLLDSSKWKLDRGKAYDVTLVAGARAVQVKALAESKTRGPIPQRENAHRRCSRGERGRGHTAGAA
jgi:hypothetical protein